MPRTASAVSADAARADLLAVCAATESLGVMLKILGMLERVVSYGIAGYAMDWYSEALTMGTGWQ